MASTARAYLYRAAADTGLRASELRSLTWKSFAFDPTQLTVTVEAAYSKGCREDTRPLLSDLAQDLEAWMYKRGDGPDARVFEIPMRGKRRPRTAEMLRADLARVGILYEEDGELGDFHALRHTFITDLVDSEAAPKDAQALAHHSSIVLTVDRYYRPSIQGHRSVIERLGQTKRDAKRKRLDISR